MINLQITNQEPYFTFEFHKKVSLSKESTGKQQELNSLQEIFAEIGQDDRRTIVGTSVEIHEAIKNNIGDAKEYINHKTGQLTDTRSLIINASNAYPYYNLSASSVVIDAKSIGVPLDLSILLLQSDITHKFQTEFICPLNDLILLRKVSEDYGSKGMDQIRKETAYKAAVIQHAIDNNSRLNHAVPEDNLRSKTVLGFNYTGSLNIQQFLKEKGYTIEESTQKNLFLINNFTTHSKEQFEQLSDLLASVK